MTNQLLDPPPCEFIIRRECKFKARGIKPGNTKKTPGCAHCGRGMLDFAHLGGPPSMNSHSIMHNAQNFNATESAWQWRICLGLIESGLPRGLATVNVEIQIGFETYTGRDEGNHRWMPEKSLGDGLVKGYGYNKDVVDEDGKKVKDDKGKVVKEWVQLIDGGWLSEDTFFPIRRYSVGNLEGVHDPGQSWMRVMLFGSFTEPEPSPRSTR